MPRCIAGALVHCSTATTGFDPIPVKENWKIIHVHYSSMPVTGEREGF